MPIEFRCEGCGKLLRVPDESAGRKAQCPECQKVLMIPAAPAAGGSAPEANAAFGGAAAGGPVNPFASPQAEATFGAEPGAVAGPTQIDLGDVFSSSWEIFKRHWGMVIGVVIGTGIVNNVAWQVAQVIARQNGLVGLVLIVGSIGLSIFLQIGVSIVLLKIAHGEPTELGDLFSGARYMPRTVGASILVGLAVLAGSILLIIPGIIVALMLCYFGLAIIDRDAGVFDSISFSSEITRGNKWTLFVMIVASFGLILLGLLACGVGILVAVPYISLVFVVSYLKATGQPTAASQSAAPSYTPPDYNPPSYNPPT